MRMRMRIAFAIIRVVVAVAIIAAVVGQLTLSIGYWTAHGVTDIGLSIVNFFSFFTILSNVLSVVALLVGASLLVTRTGLDPHAYTVFRGCVATYMIITGIVYNLLLRGIELPQGTTLEWANEVFHVAAPIWLLLDWLLAPGRGRLEWSRIVTILVFPLVWIAYTLIRGPYIHNELTGQPYWYPYPFLNPNLPGASYWTVAGYSVAIAMAMAVVGLGVILVSRRMRPLGR